MTQLVTVHPTIQVSTRDRVVAFAALRSINFGEACDRLMTFALERLDGGVTLPADRRPELLGPVSLTAETRRR